MSVTREDEFIESWSGSTRDDLSEAELNQALAAYHSLRNSSADIGTDAAVTDSVDELQLQRQIAGITALIPNDNSSGDPIEAPVAVDLTLSAESEDSTVVSIDSTRKQARSKRRWAPMAGAMAACLALAVGLNFQGSRSFESDDWGQQIVVRGSSDIETIDVSVTVANPNKSAKSLVALLEIEKATFRSEKQARSQRRVIFRLNEEPQEDVRQALLQHGIESLEIGQWYVLDFKN